MNKNLIKILYWIVIIAIFAVVSALIYFNKSVIVTYYCPIFQKSLTKNFIYPIILMFISGGIAGFLTCLLLQQKQSDLCSAYQKRHESISIENESDKARISTLEAKIQTLEAALKSALDK